MAVLKCKMCGGELNIEEGSTVCECEYCGSKQTIPTADNEKKMTLFARANRLRFNNEFDKAAGIYENIIADFPEEAEAYWGLVLCKYGIEYVDDPGTAKKVPTCHRSSFDSVFEDNNFDMVMEYADPISKRVYREEAKQIEELRKGIIEVSSKEEPYDIFICYKETDEDGNRTLDSVIAQDIYTALTDKGYKVFFSRITLEDKLGQEYEPYIFAALHSAKVMLAVGTQYEYYDAVWVKNEWSRYLQLISSGEKKVLIPCFKDLDAYDMPKEFARLQAQDMGKIGAMQDLVRGIEKIIGKRNDGKAESAVRNSEQSALNTVTEALLKRGNLALTDGDFSKAVGFYDRALDNNPESAQSYWGKTLCAYQSKDAYQLADRLFLMASSESQKSGIRVYQEDLIKAIREIDGSGVLNELDDSDLYSMLNKCRLNKPATEYVRTKKHCSQISEICKSEQSVVEFINNRDCDKAFKYKDEYVEKEILQFMKYFESKIPDFISATKNSTDHFKNKIEAALNQAPQLITAQEANAEQRYKSQIEQWEKAKAVYESENKNAAAEREKIEQKIDQLENEKANLRGMFTGKRRKEIENNIELLKQKLGSLSTIQAPGPKPEREQIDTTDSKSALLDVLYNLLHTKLDVNVIEKGFGIFSYETNGEKRPIKWQILKKEPDKVLVITEKGIAAEQYNTVNESVTWETCSLRQWLNNEFYNSAFDEFEKDHIVQTTVNPGKNRQYPTNSGNSTEDKIFLLSIQDAMSLFRSNERRCVKATPYAAKHSNGSYLKSGPWWLLTPGCNNYCAASIHHSGVIFDYGSVVNSKDILVRPAMWIKIDNN